MIDVKEGDTVYRYLSTIPTPIELKVTKVRGSVIFCGPWTFSKETGGEIDIDCGWDGIRTGSVIETKKRG